MNLKQFMEVDLPYADGQVGDWMIESVPVEPSAAILHNLACELNGRGVMKIMPGIIRRLTRVSDQVTVMSSTLMEYRTNLRFVRKARGTVLINGLGLAIVPFALLAKKEIESVTIIEREAAVIDMVAPYLKDARVRIVHEDAMFYSPTCSYDFVWHDIWDDINPKNVASMTKLWLKYQRHCHWQGCWSSTMIYARMVSDYLTGAMNESGINARQQAVLLAHVKNLNGRRMKHGQGQGKETTAR